MSDKYAGPTNALPGNTRADVWDLLPGYALDALDDPEQRAAERLLASDADARRVLDEYREVVAAFVVDAEPPAALRVSVLQRVAVTSRQPAATARPDVDPAPDADVVDLSARRRRRQWGLAAVSVAAAVAIAVPTTVAVQVTAERDVLRQQADIVSQMLADPDASVLRSSVAGGGEASMVAADGDMFFRADDLPEPAPGQGYQLWVVDGDGSVSSAGMLALRDGQATSLVRGSDGVGLAVSVEPDAGSRQPTTEPVVVLGT
ncbi:anti-sigma factor domain-containing protein [Promicromonospora sp. NPDC057488]|uniref:anti-sigma factor n=1 Tax=Promicromonospora sp. NPDC057488 TaxID=3346147 RepID=UPI00366DF826